MSGKKNQAYAESAQALSLETVYWMHQHIFSKKEKKTIHLFVLMRK